MKKKKKKTSLQVFGERIRAPRKTKGLSQEDLALGPFSATASWLDVTNMANIVNHENQVILVVSPCERFYRLKYS